MNAADPLEPFLAPVLALQKLIEQFDNQGIIIGGIAASILGKPRLTADVDAMMLVSIDQIGELMALARKEGLFPRLPDAEAFARKNRVLLLQHEASGIDVDISLGLLPFEHEAVARSAEYRAGSLRLRLPSPEDLIIMKAIAHRPKDLLDIEAIIATQPELDKERIRFWVQQFADLLEMPEMWDDLAGLLYPNL